MFLASIELQKVHLVFEIIDQNVLLLLILISFNHSKQLIFTRFLFCRQVFKELDKGWVSNIVNSQLSSCLGHIQVTELVSSFVISGKAENGIIVADMEDFIVSKYFFARNRSGNKECLVAFVCEVFTDATP